MEQGDDLGAFSHIAPADREAFRFATMALNLPEHEAWFMTWDLLAETRSHMEEPNYVILEGAPSGNTWVPLQTTDINQINIQINAICASSATSRVHLVLSDLEETRIHDDFLLNCDQLVSCVVRCSKVTAIGIRCFHFCSSLTSLDISGLTSVTSIGDFFLHECRSLTSFNMSGLTALTSIGGSFLCKCRLLTSIGMSGLTAVTSIRGNFLYECKLLTSIDMSGLTAVTSIGNFFLYGCSSLASIDMSGLTSVTSIGGHFLGGCQSLTSINMSGLTAVTSMGDGFLNGCSFSVLSLYFLNGCSSLTLSTVDRKRFAAYLE